MAYANYMRENWKYTGEATVRLTVPVTIKRDGTVGEIGQLFGPPEGFIAEVRRVMLGMPRWEPAVRKGRTVEEVVQLPLQASVY